jgi:DNA-binding NarL/FixJ family response regulator
VVAQPVRVLVVDDDYYVREAVTALVSRDARTRLWGAVRGVPDAISSLVQSDGPPPDVILLDVRLAEGDRAGIEGISALREACQSCRILVTSVDDDDDVVLAAVQAGADGFVSKNETGERVVSALTHVAEGKFLLSPGLAGRLIDKVAELGTYAERLPEPTEAVGMTESMRKTLYLYVVCGLSAQQVADELQVSLHTVNSRVKAAYAVLGANNRTEAFRILVEGV